MKSRLTSLKMIIVLIIFLVVTSFITSDTSLQSNQSSTSTLWGNRYYVGHLAIQEVGSWCAFACMEMYDGKEACIHATDYLTLYGQNIPSEGCCQQPSFRPAVCETGVKATQLPFFLTKTYGTPCNYIKSVPQYFAPKNGTTPFYTFPCFGFTHNYSHCIFVIGVEGIKTSWELRYWTLFYVDPWTGKFMSNPLTDILLQNLTLIYL